MVNALKKQLAIACELKAPKGQYNSFGKYNYRSREDILEAVKPLLEKHSCALVEEDTVLQIGERYYVKACATLYDLDGGEDVSAYGWAREDDTKKGMDGSQITGTASSYARKYALNALFLIDDTKDADTDEYQKQQKPKQRSLDEKLDAGLLAVAKRNDTNTADVRETCEGHFDLSTDEGKEAAIGALSAIYRGEVRLEDM